MVLEFKIDGKKWGKRRMKYFANGLALWSLLFCLGGLYFNNIFIVLLTLIVMFIAGQFRCVVENWDKFYGENPEVIV